MAHHAAVVVQTMLADQVEVTVAQIPGGRTVAGGLGAGEVQDGVHAHGEFLGLARGFQQGGLHMAQPLMADLMAAFSTPRRPADGSCVELVGTYQLDLMPAPKQIEDAASADDADSRARRASASRSYRARRGGPGVEMKERQADVARGCQFEHSIGAMRVVSVERGRQIPPYKANWRARELDGLDGGTRRDLADAGGGLLPRATCRCWRADHLRMRGWARRRPSLRRGHGRDGAVPAVFGQPLPGTLEPCGTSHSARSSQPGAVSFRVWKSFL